MVEEQLSLSGVEEITPKIETPKIEKRTVKERRQHCIDTYASFRTRYGAYDNGSSSKRSWGI